MEPLKLARIVYQGMASEATEKVLWRAPKGRAFQPRPSEALNSVFPQPLEPYPTGGEHSTGFSPDQRLKPQQSTVRERHG